MPTMPTDTLPPARAFGGCLIMVAAVGAPIVTAVVMPAPWWMKIFVAFLVGICTVFVATVALPRVVLMDRAQPAGPPPLPGPDDPVHYVDYDERGKGCTITGLHEPHYFFWRSVVPYEDADGLLTTVPMHGSQWCRGVR
jgi:hypothetical protein